jgi:hypothetical protein
MLLLLKPDNGWSAISPENRDPFFRIALKTWSSKGAQAPKKEARPKRPGITLLAAPQYIQKSPKNNGFKGRFSRWANDLLVRSYRNWAGIAGYCRRADELAVVRV